MKRNYLKMIVPTMMLAIALSCTKDFDPTPSGGTTESSARVLNAKEYFQIHAQDLSFPSLSLDKVQTRSSMEKNPIVPQWDKSRTILGDIFDVVQVPLEDGVEHMALKESVVNGSAIKEEAPWSSFLLVTSNKKTNAREMLVFSIAPDVKWLNDCPQGVSSISFNEYVKGDVGNYSGVILVSFLDGRVSAGIRYIDGKITHRLSTNLLSKDMLKQEVRTPSSFKMCMHGSMDSKTTTKTRSFGSDNSECIDKDGSGVTGYCQGCSTWHEEKDSDGTKRVSAHEDVLNTFPKQSTQNTCTTSSMAYMNNIFGGSHDENWYNEAVGNMTDSNGKDVSININVAGLNGSEIDAITKSAFVREEFVSYDHAIKNKQLVMTNMDSHSVIITGSNGDKYTYMDPEVGYLQEAHKSKFGSNYNFTISGVK